MGSLFSKPKVPKPKPAPVAPQIEDQAVQEAAADAMRRRQRARGFRSTILSNLMDSAASPGTQATLGR